jgi:hypothetical protein
MVIILRDKTEHFLDDERGRIVKKAYSTGAKVIDLYGDETALVVASTIAQILSDEQYEKTYDHAPKGAPVEEHKLDLSWLRNGTPISPITETGAKWLALIAFNNQALAKTGYYGPFVTVEQWEAYELDGTMPNPKFPLAMSFRHGR